MPQCKNCNIIFSKTEIIKGKVVDLHKRRYCLKCNPLGEKRFVGGPALSPVRTRELICQRCKCTYTYHLKNKRLGSPTYYNGNLSKCAKCLLMEKRHKRKAEAISYKGGKCQSCGYNKCNKALAFHHLDPNEKEFKISDYIMGARAKLIAELDKCILLCHNCHAETHDDIL